MNAPDRMLAVDWIGGNQFPIYRASALAEVGAPDATLFWGYEELDLGLRLRRAGYSLYRDRDYEVRTPFDHPKKVESGPAVPWRRYYTTRNLVAIMIRESTRLRATAIGLRCVAGALVGAKGRRLRTALSAARGLTDGLRGSSGWSARAGGPDR